MKNTTKIGNISEAAITYKLLSKGFPIYIPFDTSSRFDLLIEQDSKFKKIQIKTGRIKAGAIQFRNYSVTSAGPKSYSKLDIDYYGVYCPDNERCYLIPVDICCNAVTSLRIEFPKNNAVSNIRWAKDFEI